MIELGHKKLGVQQLMASPSEAAIVTAMSFSTTPAVAVRITAKSLEGSGSPIRVVDNCL